MELLWCYIWLPFHLLLDLSFPHLLIAFFYYLCFHVFFLLFFCQHSPVQLSIPTDILLPFVQLCIVHYCYWLVCWLVIRLGIIFNHLFVLFVFYVVLKVVHGLLQFFIQLFIKKLRFWLYFFDLFYLWFFLFMFLDYFLLFLLDLLNRLTLHLPLYHLSEKIIFNLFISRILPLIIESILNFPQLNICLKLFRSDISINDWDGFWRYKLICVNDSYLVTFF